jgi:hypothetical protein
MAGCVGTVSVNGTQFFVYGEQALYGSAAAWASS